jgi:hypothetical protein
VCCAGLTLDLSLLLLCVVLEPRLEARLALSLSISFLRGCLTAINQEEQVCHCVIWMASQSPTCTKAVLLAMSVRPPIGCLLPRCCDWGPGMAPLKLKHARGLLSGYFDDKMYYEPQSCLQASITICTHATAHLPGPLPLISCSMLMIRAAMSQLR